MALFIAVLVLQEILVPSMLEPSEYLPLTDDQTMAIIPFPLPPPAADNDRPSAMMWASDSVRVLR